MLHLSQAAVSCVGYQDIAHHSCSRVPSAPGLVDPEEVDVPVEVRLQIPWRHPREAPKVALEPGARVVHHLHPLQEDLVRDVGPVLLRLARRPVQVEVLIEPPRPLRMSSSSHESITGL